MKSGDRTCIMELSRQPKTGGSPRDEKYNRNHGRHANTFRDQLWYSKMIRRISDSWSASISVDIASARSTHERTWRDRVTFWAPCVWSKALPVIAQQKTMPLKEALKTLDMRCSWSCKKNSRGLPIYIRSWTQSMTRTWLIRLFDNAAGWPLLIITNEGTTRALALILPHNAAMRYGQRLSERIRIWRIGFYPFHILSEGSKK